ncbi:MAG: TRAP transporter substrate-binding protein [Phycisphaerae bacterium]
MNVRWAAAYLLLLVFLAGTLSGCGGGDEQGRVTVLKLAHGLDASHPVHQGMVYMAERAYEKSGGQLRIDIYPNEQLGSERECLELVQLGILAMTKSSSAPMEGFVPTFRVLGLPYLFRDDEHMWKVFNGPIGRELLAAGEAKGLKGLCFYDSGARSFYTKSKRVETPADLAGLKIRVQKSIMSMRMVAAMGGAPTPIDWGELYTSLQQGVVDAAENNPPSFHISHHYELCRYYILDEHLRVPDVLVINPKIWHSLSPELQRILQEAVDESVIEQRRLWKKAVDEALAEVERAGVTIIRPDKRPFREAVRSLWAQFEGTPLGKLAERIQAVE